ncbi:MAG: hypothetical protein ABIR34_13365 [Marmoricola sp.]
MRRTISRLPIAPVGAVLATLLLAAGCGNVEVKTKDGQKKPEQTPSSSPAADAVDTTPGEGDWLLGMSTATGSDAETSKTTYIVYNPSTGKATAHQMPGVQAASATPEEAGLLVSSSRLWAIPDTGISRGEEGSGRLKVYSITSGTTKIIDIRQRTGHDDVRPVGWAFDPNREDTLRVVDTKNRVWSLNVAGGRAAPEPRLATGNWVFTNGFDPNTGEPWVESIDSDATKPAGQGPADTSPVTRRGGTVLPADSPALSKLPASPCRLGAGFTTGAGVTWTFCADDPTVTTYYLPKDGAKWTAYGKPSASVAPVAAAFSLVLPPTE